MTVLDSGVPWSDAAGQIFFTLGATLGALLSFGVLISCKPPLVDTLLCCQCCALEAVASCTSVALCSIVFELGCMRARATMDRLRFLGCVPACRSLIRFVCCAGIMSACAPSSSATLGASLFVSQIGNSFSSNFKYK